MSYYLANGQNSPSISIEQAQNKAFHAAMQARYQQNQHNNQASPMHDKEQKELSIGIQQEILSNDIFLESIPKEDYLTGTGTVSGVIFGHEGIHIEFANVILYDAKKNQFIKATVTAANGQFEINQLVAGNYMVVVSYLGLPELKLNAFEINDNQKINLGESHFKPADVMLGKVEVVANRPIVELKVDRLVFNVDETSNSTGGNAIDLLKKAPTVMVDPNNDIRINGRSGAAIYINGRSVPITGDQLTYFLQSLTAEQIERIEIISNPGIKYDAEGSAGIIDIVLKQNIDKGTNASLSNTISKGKYFRFNNNASVNRSTKASNVFFNGGFGKTNIAKIIKSNTEQNDVLLKYNSSSQDEQRFQNARMGADFFIAKRHTIGIESSLYQMFGDIGDDNQTLISNNTEIIDSILLVNNSDSIVAKHRQFNVKYKFNNPINNQVWKMDLNQGVFRNVIVRNQPNHYLNSNFEVLSETNNQQKLPSNISILSFNFDHERLINSAKLSLGAKWNKIETNNVFESKLDSFVNLIPEFQQFAYREHTFATYIGLLDNFDEIFTYNIGVRAEMTKANSDNFNQNNFTEDTTIQYDYFNLFPNLSLSYMFKPELTIQSNYIKRIRRPNFNALNPFETAISDLKLEQGNPILIPEIVNVFSIGLVVKYIYNIKFTYSTTNDQITPFNTPIESDIRANIFSWNNINNQKQFRIELNAPLELAKWWQTYNFVSMSQLKFTSTFTNGFSPIESKTTSFIMYHQSSFRLPYEMEGDLSMWYQGNGIWNAVYNHEPFWELSLGLRKSFLQNRLHIKVAINDIFASTSSSGQSDYSGRTSDSNVSFDNRRVALSFSYNFGKHKYDELTKEKDSAGQNNTNRVEYRDNLF